MHLDFAHYIRKLMNNNVQASIYLFNLKKKIIYTGMFIFQVTFMPPQKIKESQQVGQQEKNCFYGQKEKNTTPSLIQQHKRLQISNDH